MKHIFKYFLSALALITAISACQKKVDDLPFYGKGTNSTLTSSTATVAPTQSTAADTLITLSWTDAKYATDSSTEKYIVELDTSGGNFSNAVQYTTVGSTNFALTGEQINNMLVTWGLGFNEQANINIRVISSYGNNNERLNSNVVTVKMTPYAVPFTLQVADPGPFEVGLDNKDQVVERFYWDAPVLGTAKFTYAVQYDKPGNNFAGATTVSVDTLLFSDFTGLDFNKLAMAYGIPSGQAGDIEFRAIATVNGNQKIYSDPVTINIKPTELIFFLYAPGSYQGWSPGSAPMLASLDKVSYEGYVNFSSDATFKFTNQPDWNGTNYGSTGDGIISTSGGDIAVPMGYYLVKVNTTDLTWTKVLTSWGVVGDATPGSWDNSTPLVYDPVAAVWKATVVFSGTGAFKFRANNTWDINLGGTGTNLSYGGDNIPSPSAGPHVVTLNLSNPLKYTYTVQ